VLDLASPSPGLGAILDFDSALQMFLGIIAVTLCFLSEITFHFCTAYFVYYHTFAFFAFVFVCVSDIWSWSPWIETWKRP
jgi:hypothetical protein